MRNSIRAGAQKCISLSVEFALLDHALMHLLVHQHGVGHTRIAADHLTMQQNHVDHLLTRGKFSTVSAENNYFFCSPAWPSKVTHHSTKSVPF
jgi:hypothetical protein